LNGAGRGAKKVGVNKNWRGNSVWKAANPDKVAAAKAKPQLVGWFVGQVMKTTGGKANPAVVNAILKARLGLPENG